MSRKQTAKAIRGVRLRSGRNLSLRAAGAAALLMILIVGLTACGSSEPAGEAMPTPQPTIVGTEAAPQAPATTVAATEAVPATEVPAGTEPTTAPQTEPATQSAGPVEDGQPLIARVNGQPIYLDTFQKQVEQTEQALSDQGILLEGADGDAQRAQIRENVLKGLMEQALIEQAATAMQINVTDDELESSLQASADQGAQALDEWLNENQMTMDELREMQRSQLITGKVIQRLSDAVPTSAEQVHARHIFTTDKAKAEAILARLNAGENFAAIAQQESEDYSSAANGGDLGWFPRETPMMPPAVMDAAFSLQPGETSGVIGSEVGYHIVRVEAREQNRPLTQDMLLFVRQRAFETWLAQQMAAAQVERYDVTQ